MKNEERRVKNAECKIPSFCILHLGAQAHQCRAQQSSLEGVPGGNSLADHCPWCRFAITLNQLMPLGIESLGVAGRKRRQSDPASCVAAGTLEIVQLPDPFWLP